MSGRAKRQKGKTVTELYRFAGVSVPSPYLPMDPVERAAHEILATIEATYKPAHDYVLVDTKEFQHLDIRYYDRTARVLSVEGFRQLADVEDRTITATPNGVLMPVLIRSMLAKDGTLAAFMYHPRIKSLTLRALLWLLRRLPGKVVDMQTEFDDGTFVVTTNAVSAAAIDLPALISAEFMPANSSPLGIFQRHLTRVAAHAAERPGIRARSIRSHAELVASQNRENAIKAAYRGQVVGISREELDRLTLLSKRNTSAVQAALIRERVRRAS